MSDSKTLEQVVAEAMEASIGRPGRPELRIAGPACEHGDEADACSVCFDAREAEAKHRADVRVALRCIPEAYRWAFIGSPDFASHPLRADVSRLALELSAAKHLVLVGPAGAGKTSLACAALRQAIERAPLGTKFVHAFRLSSARIQFRAGQGEAPYVEQAIRSQMVLIDDVGNESSVATSAVADVVFERHAEGKATWYTTAYEAEELARKYGDGTARRIYEGARVVRLGPK